METMKIPLTKGKVAIVDANDYEGLSKHKWHAVVGKYTCYAARGVRAGKKTKAVYMHRQIQDLPYGDKRLVDHRDHNGLNNSRSNLRTCGKSENAMNSAGQKGSASKYKGVGVGRWGKRWQAKIKIKEGGKNKYLYLGTFVTEEEAAAAYDKKAKELHGEFALLNLKDENQ
jgi:hypothetical protein